MQSYSFNYMGQKLALRVRLLMMRALLRQVGQLLVVWGGDELIHLQAMMRSFCFFRCQRCACVCMFCDISIKPPNVWWVGGI